MNLENLALFAQQGEGGGIGGLFFFVIWLLIVILVVAGFWKTFEKAGKPGWGAIIPIYNVILLLEIAGKPIWWILLLFIPIVNIVISVLVAIDVAKNFGKDVLFGLGLAFLGFIFYPILGFGDARYQPVNR
jgi:F0F1-type ATP synthase membrane subunit a